MQPASYTNGKYGENRLLRQKGFELGTGQQAERLLSPAVDGRSKTGNGRRYEFEPVVENDGTDNANA
jgi:hypothetical protein